jgi:hypothetical protein
METKSNRVSVTFCLDVLCSCDPRLCDTGVPIALLLHIIRVSDAPMWSHLWSSHNALFRQVSHDQRIDTILQEIASHQHTMMYKLLLKFYTTNSYRIILLDQPAVVIEIHLEAKLGDLGYREYRSW